LVPITVTGLAREISPTNSWVIEDSEYPIMRMGLSLPMIINAHFRLNR